MKRTVEYIRAKDGNPYPVKAYRVGELIVHRPIDRADINGVKQQRTGWTVTHARTGGVVIKLVARVGHAEAMEIARELFIEANILWPKLRYDEKSETVKDSACLKAIGELIYPIRDRLAQEWKLA